MPTVLSQQVNVFLGLHQEALQEEWGAYPVPVKAADVHPRTQAGDADFSFFYQHLGEYPYLKSTVVEAGSTPPDWQS
ncbi:MAG: hypothetical protein ABIO17_13080 [Pseudoxanthomonas sp.]